MAASAVPLEDVRKAGRFVTAVRDYPHRSGVRARLLRWYYLPEAVETITLGLSGARTGELSREEAREFYEHLLVAHQALRELLDDVRARRHWRVLAWRWLRRLENELDELDDLLDTLAWGFDPDLQQFTDVTVSEVERRRQTQCRSR